MFSFFVALLESETGASSNGLSGVKNELLVLGQLKKTGFITRVVEGVCP
ncbi:hypothetical protein VTL71DRAFT_681 [Oculimacula yallundae]|uniref:Uncharacterized protein n=1 Tax=Oculimacula yallundae TaxID=86028 RepID=A0ABR4D0Q9_9HELO